MKNEPMMNNPPLALSDFDYLLPPELIAQAPLAERSASRLLVVGAQLHDAQMPQLPQYLQPGDLLVFNDTRVLHARLYGQKDTGGHIEVLVERIIGEHEALAQIRASKSPKAGTRLLLEHTLKAEVVARVGDFFHLRFDIQGPLLEALEAYGHLPLPPYIERTAGSADESRYQTVYARHLGSVAAPTAGLHFDAPLLAALTARGIGCAYVTLHVGAGTFQPVRVENLAEHTMHSEYYVVPEETVDAIARTHQQGGRIICVGTTSLRALESAAQSGTLCAGSRDTRLFITPGYRFQIADMLLTNFHLPKSTLLMLVSALAGTENIRRAYAHAIAQRYRFFSYGDAMLLTRTV